MIQTKQNELLFIMKDPWQCTDENIGNIINTIL
jgi:hypothetical protein